MRAEDHIGPSDPHQKVSRECDARQVMSYYLSMTVNDTLCRLVPHSVVVIIDIEFAPRLASWSSYCVLGLPCTINDTIVQSTVQLIVQPIVQSIVQSIVEGSL